MTFKNFFKKAIKEKEFDIIIFGVFGRNNELGEGKTLLLSYLADEFNKQLPDKPIYSDYKLPFVKGYIYHISDFVKCRDCGMFLDDVIPIFDARQSGSNIMETWILNTCRKYKINLGYTAQLKGAIDGRLRKISNFVIEIEKREFPTFYVWIWTKTFKKVDEFEITFGKRILNIYNTYEVVKRKITKEDLLLYAKKFKNRKGFRQIAKAKWRFKNELADTIFTLLLVEDYDSIQELLIPHGFELA